MSRVQVPLLTPSRRAVPCGAAFLLSCAALQLPAALRGFRTYLHMAPTRAPNICSHQRLVSHQHPPMGRRYGPGGGGGNCGIVHSGTEDGSTRAATQAKVLRCGGPSPRDLGGTECSQRLLAPACPPRPGSTPSSPCYSWGCSHASPSSSNSRHTWYGSSPGPRLSSRSCCSSPSWCSTRSLVLTMSMTYCRPLFAP